MQALVEEKVDKYIRLFGLCTCPRCRIDVKALTLTSLPAKYVVIGEQERIPMLSVYEGRYNAAVVSQVMWACKKVMDNPRHQL
ncbi:MAG: late competence development ComFB family protein [Lawsonibacter sp.]